MKRITKEDREEVLRVNTLLIDAFLNEKYIKMENYRIYLNHLIDKMLDTNETR